MEAPPDTPGFTRVIQAVLDILKVSKTDMRNDRCDNRLEFIFALEFDLPVGLVPPGMPMKFTA